MLTKLAVFRVLTIYKRDIKLALLHYGEQIQEMPLANSQVTDLFVTGLILSFLTQGKSIRPLERAKTFSLFTHFKGS